MRLTAASATASRRPECSISPLTTTPIRSAHSWASWRRGGLQGPRQRAAPLLDGVDARQGQAAAQPVADAVEHLPRPGAGVVLGQRLVRLLLDLDQQAGQRLQRRRLEVAGGQRVDAARQRLGPQLRVGQDAAPGPRRGPTAPAASAASPAPDCHSSSSSLQASRAGDAQQQAAREPDAEGAQAAERRLRRSRRLRATGRAAGPAASSARGTGSCPGGPWRRAGPPACGAAAAAGRPGRRPAASSVEARAVGAVLGRERDGRVGEVVQLGQRGVEVGLLAARRGRVVRARRRTGSRPPARRGGCVCCSSRRTA